MTGSARTLAVSRRTSPAPGTALSLSAGGAAFALFCADYIIQTKGRWAGRPLYLEWWQLRIESEMLRTVTPGAPEGEWIDLDEDDRIACETDPSGFYAALREEYEALDPEPGRRVYREAYVQISKKTGKSMLSSSHALYFLIADGEEGAEVYSAATARDQARIVFDQARDTVLASPKLQDFIRAYRYVLTVIGSSSVYRVISADAGTQEGLNPSAAVIDELHRHKTRDLYDVLTSGDVARDQPFTLNITNAGVDPASLCYDVYLQAKKVLAGDPDARSDLYAYVPELDDEQTTFVVNGLAAHIVDGAPLDPEVMRLAKSVNEASWINEAVILRDFERQPVNVFKRRRLNSWTGSEEAWLPAGAWDACLAPELALAGEVVVGIDMGLKRDTAGVITIGEVDGRYVVRARAWGVRPADPQKPLPPAHELVLGDKIEFDLVEEHIRQAAREHRLLEAAYDPWRFERSAQDLEAEGIMMVEFAQTNERMCPATQLAYNAIVEGKLAHDGDQFLRAQVDAAIAKETGRGWRLTKKEATRPCDLAVALVMALARLIANEGGGPMIDWF